MTGMSSLNSYEKKGYRVTGVSFGENGRMTVHTVRKGSAKKQRPKYNYKRISEAILKAKTPNDASLAAMKAREKLDELLKDTGSGEDSDPDLKAAIIHVKKMELIAKRKKKHLEQEEKASKGKAIPGDDKAREDEALSKSLNKRQASETSKLSEENAKKALKEEKDRLTEEIEQTEKKITEEIEQMEQKMKEEMLEDLSKLSEKLMRDEKKILKEAFPELDGFEDVSNMSAKEVKELKRKHRNNEWRDISKADMNYLKAKFYRLQQEKTAAGIKGHSFGGNAGNTSFAMNVPMDIGIDVSMDIGMDVGVDALMDMELPIDNDIGAVVDMVV